MTDAQKKIIQNTKKADLIWNAKFLHKRLLQLATDARERAEAAEHIYGYNSTPAQSTEASAEAYAMALNAFETAFDLKK